MPQYVIIASDGKDSEALPRRMNARPDHLNMARTLKGENHLVVAGATLNEKGEMNGSVMIVTFDDEKQLQEWLDKEPYVKNGVWQHYEIRPFRVADV